MDSRQEPRLDVDQEISVTLLGDTEVTIPAKIVNLSGKGMGLESGLPVPPGGALKIELPDTMLLGEVVYCRRQGGRYQVGIALKEALYHTRALAALAERLLSGTSGQRAYAAVKRNHQDSQQTHE